MLQPVEAAKRETRCPTNGSCRGEIDHGRAEAATLGRGLSWSPDETKVIVEFAPTGETVTDRIAELEVVAASEHGGFVDLVVRLVNGDIDTGALLGPPSGLSQWRISGFGTMPGKAAVEGLRFIAVVRWAEEVAKVPRPGERLIAIRGPQKI